MCYDSKPYSARPNTFYGLDPSLQTCEELAYSPTYFKKPILVALATHIYCCETFVEEYMSGKLIITVFDASALYDQWQLWQIDMSVRISNQIDLMLPDEQSRTLFFIVRGTKLSPYASVSKL